MQKNYTGISLICCPFLAPPSSPLKQIKEGFITVEGKSVEVEVFLGGDYKVSKNPD